MNENSKIENQIYNAVAMIVDDRLVSAQFDKTVAASIVSCVNDKTGVYKVRYQDAIYEASANDTTTVFKDGARVYVLVPQGDFLKPKKIIGLVENTIIEYDSSLTMSPYLPVGNSCGSMSGELKVSSYDKDSTKIQLYPTISSSNNNEEISAITINNQALIDQLELGATHIRFKIDIKTIIPQIQRRGDFGIVIIVKLQNNKTETIKLSVRDMTGDPYCSIDYITQYKDIEIKKEDFLEISEIYYFENNFNTLNEETLPLDIFLKGFQVYGVAHNSSSLFSNYILEVKEKNNNNTITADNQTLMFVADLYKRLQPTVTDASAQYYWFRQNGVITAPEEITSASYGIKYHEYAGRGWECLNSGVPVLDEDTGLYYINWSAKSKEYQITKDSLKVSNEIYKCICDYEGVRTTTDFIVYNNLAPYLIKIECDKDILTTNSDSTNLIVKLYQRGEDGKYETEVTSGFNVEWNVFPNTEIEAFVQDKYNTIIQVSGQDIEKYNKYICTVRLNETNETIGSQHITIKKEIAPKENSTYIKFTNDNQVFLYDEGGLSPVKNPLKSQITLPLSFSVYTVKNGEEIDVTAEIESDTVEWRIPKKNTLLECLHAEDIEDSTDEYAVVKSRGILTFAIKDHYSFNAVNNFIRLKLEYEGQPVIASTNFQFSKEGALGTNGTDLIAVIEPINKNENISILGYPTIFCYQAPGTDIKTATAFFNYRKKNDTENDGIINKALLEVNIWKNGELINATDESIKSIKWSIRKPNDTNINSFFTITAPSQRQCKITEINSHPKDANNNNIFYSVISCEIEYSNGSEDATRFVYADYPLAWCFINKAYSPVENYQYQFDLTTGFNAVQYQADGTTPSYNKESAFEVQILKEVIKETESIISQESNNNYTFIWQSLNTEMLTFTSNGTMMTPTPRYSDISNTGVTCAIYQDNIYLATIYMPIYFYINKYAYTAINGWDGNVVQIQDKSVFTPQLGAGTKNSDNTFSGLLLGKLQKYEEQQEIDHGLMGFNKGVRTLFLSSTDGSAVFGSAGTGEIKLDSVSSTISGGGYSDNNQTGMCIDLAKPSIKYGNKYFEVDEHGILHASGAQISGTLTVEKLIAANNMVIDDSFKGVFAMPEDLQATNTALTNVQNNMATKDDVNALNAQGQQLAADLGATNGAVASVMEIASAANGQLAQWAYNNNKAYINGSKIYAGTVSTTQLNVGYGGNLYATGYDTFEHITSNNLAYQTDNASKGSFTLVNNTETQPFYGSQCLKIVCNNGVTECTGHLGAEDNGYGSIPVQAGTIYLISMWVKSTVANSEIEIWAVRKTGRNATTATDGMKHGTAKCSSTVGTWKQVWFEYEGESGYPYISLRLDNNTPGSTLYIDAIQIERADSKGKTPNDFTPAGMTTIDGGHILTNSISAKSIKTNEITALGKITGGQFSLGNGNFIVDENGNLTAKDATLSGAIGVDENSYVGTWRLHGGNDNGGVSYFYHSYYANGQSHENDNGPYSGMVINANHPNAGCFYIWAAHPGDTSSALTKLNHNGNAFIGRQSNGTYTLEVDTGNVCSFTGKSDQKITQTYGSTKTVSVTGTLKVNGQSVTGSDRRLKKDIVELKNSKYIEFFDNINPVSFNMINDDNEDHLKKIRLGFIAQDIEDALIKSNLTPNDFAGLKKDCNTDYYYLAYDQFIALNTAKIKQLEEIIKSQQKQIDELKSKLS